MDPMGLKLCAQLIRQNWIYMHFYTSFFSVGSKISKQNRCEKPTTYQVIQFVTFWRSPATNLNHELARNVGAKGNWGYNHCKSSYNIITTTITLLITGRDPLFSEMAGRLGKTYATHLYILWVHNIQNILISYISKHHISLSRTKFIQL